MRKAFTLIELLVVIAIIAILAAILFPVFAQAKEAAKKTQTLAQFKQIGTATAIYSSDTDDILPLSMSFNNATQTWRSLNFHSVPAGQFTAGARDAEPRRSEEGVFVMNSIQPYTKNFKMYEAAGLTNKTISATLIAGATPANVGLTFNGLLHAYSGTAMNRPSSVPLYWMGNFKANNVGLTTSNPVLACDNGSACQFNPGGYPSNAGATSGNTGYGYYWFGNGADTTLFIYGKGFPVVYADTSAKFIGFGNLPKWPQYASNVNTPWSSMDPAPTAKDGAPYWSVDCVAPGGTKGVQPYYWGWFRPDSEGNFTANECDPGGG